MAQRTFDESQPTPDPLSVLALLEDEQKFKLGGVDSRNLTISTVNYQPNGAMQGRPTPGLAAQPSKWATCHLINPHHEETQVHSNPTARPSIQCIQRPKMHQVTDPQRQQSEGRAKRPMQG
ncbi:hypothetical protein U9M48_035701 [Paspalum notatum var. saurae]|uniref:Uncharacterized protein n=1 Tax=Paspalum notatum var. saurae TaxID=547442 RepID=A0AAQ3X8P1_PASNO